MRIDPRIEEPTREMLGHAIRGELPALEAEIDAVGDETYAAGITLCMIIAGYIAVDLAGRWPTEADIRELARHTAASSTDYELREQDVYNYLSRGALGFQPIQEVFPDPGAGLHPARAYHRPDAYRIPPRRGPQLVEIPRHHLERSRDSRAGRPLAAARAHAPLPASQGGQETVTPGSLS